MPYIAVADTAWEQEMLAWFGRVVVRARNAAGLSQRGLAERCGLSQSTISRLERGRVANLPLARLLSLAHAVDGALPVGGCPHLHGCAWQRHLPDGPMSSDIERLWAVASASNALTRLATPASLDEPEEEGRTVTLGSEAPPPA